MHAEYYHNVCVSYHNVTFDVAKVYVECSVSRDETDKRHCRRRSSVAQSSESRSGGAPTNIKLSLERVRPHTKPTQTVSCLASPFRSVERPHCSTSA